MGSVFKIIQEKYNKIKFGDFILSNKNLIWNLIEKILFYFEIGNSFNTKGIKVKNSLYC